MVRNVKPIVIKPVDPSPYKNEIVTSMIKIMPTPITSVFNLFAEAMALPYAEISPRLKL